MSPCRARRGGGARERVSAGLHLQVHADLEQLQRRQLAHRLGTGLARQHLEGPFEPELGVGLRGDREPEVELVVAQVVVRDAGVLVDHLCRPVGMLGIHLRRHQHGGVPERAGVEDRGHLPDDALLEQPPDALHRLLFRDLRERGDVLVGPRRDREAALHQVQQAPVDVIQRHRGAVLAGAELRGRGRGATGVGVLADQLFSASHPAASFAW
jgi:hypothetical protein